MHELLTASAERDLSQLAGKIDDLIELCGRLRLENAALRAQRAALLEKNALAHSRVEAMIGRLKAMELLE